MAKKVLDLVIEKLDKIEEKQEVQSLVLERNTVTLEEHVRRTALLESEIKPIKAHVQLVNWAAKIGLALIGVAETLHQLGLF